MSLESLEKELLEREKIFELKQKELYLNEQELIYKEKLNELEKREQSLNSGQKFSKNRDERIVRNPKSVLNRIEKEKNEKEEKQKELINRELNKHRIYMDTIEEDREKELKKILNDFRKRMPELEGIYYDIIDKNKKLNIPKTQVELSFETIQLLNNVDIDILFNSYKSLIESCIFYEKYYKIDNDRRNFIDFVFDHFIDTDIGLEKFRGAGQINYKYNSALYATTDLRALQPLFTKAQLDFLKLIIENKREFYYLNFDLSIFDYNEYTKETYKSLRDSFNNPGVSIDSYYSRLSLSKIDKKLFAWIMPNSLIKPIFNIYAHIDISILYNFIEKYNIFSYVKDRFTSSFLKGCIRIPGSGGAEYTEKISLITSFIGKIYYNWSQERECNEVLYETCNNANEILKLQYIFIELIETIRPEIIDMYTDKLF